MSDEPIISAPPPPTYMRCLLSFRLTAALIVLSIPLSAEYPPLGALAGLGAVLSAITVSPADFLEEYRFRRGLLFVCSLLSLSLLLIPLLAALLWRSGAKRRKRDLAERRALVLSDVTS